MNIPTDGKMAGSFGWMQQLEGALKGEHRALRKGKLPLEFHAPTLPGNRVAVVGAEGYERVNETYRYDVELVSPLPPEVVQPALFGMSASLLMRTPEHDGRLIQGLVATLEVAGIADRGLGKDLFRYIVTIVPPLWLWTQRRRNRVFQGKTLPELMKQLLEAEKIDYRFKLNLEKYPKRALYYQRDETDYEFFERVLADGGVYFLFEHAVQDASTNGVLSAMGTGAAIAGGVGGALSSYGAAGVGGALGAAGKMGQDALHTVTRLVLGDAEDGTTPLQDYAAINDAANSAMKAGMGALSGAAKEIKDWAGDGLEAQTGFDMSDELPMDDGSKAAPGDERVYALSYRRNVRPKSVWTLERDHKEPRSWANRNRKEVVETPKLQLDFHLSLGRNGLGVDGGASVDLELDAPEIAPAKLEQELIGHNIGWLAYPSETHRPKGPFTPVEMHEHLKRSLEQLRRDSTVVEVDTDCRRLAAGYRFRLGNHPSGVLNAEYTVTALRVSAVDPEMLELGTDDPRRARPYIAKLEAVPSKDMVPRPPLPERRKHPMELGTVVRWKESADMTTFNRNEVLVRLAWDTDTEGRERPYPKSSDQQERDSVLCVPVLQPWAGDGYGLQVTPREGMQVVIGYLDAQGDRPIILGCLHSDTKPPPWSGPDAVKVGFRTQSRWPRGTYEDRAVGRTTGWSEISIDDTGDHELMVQRAERDRDDYVGNDMTETINGNRRTDIAGFDSLAVQGDRSESVAGESTLNVEGSRWEVIRGSLNHAIQGSLVQRVFLGQTHFVVGDSSETVGGSHAVQVKQDASLSVKGNLDEDNGGNRSIVTDGSLQLRVGTPEKKTSFATLVEGDQVSDVRGGVTLNAAKSIVFQCGKSRIEIGPDKITLHSETVVVQGDKSSTLASKDATLLLESDLQAFAKELHLNSSGAVLSLASDVTLQGSKLSLGSGSGKSKDAAKDKEKKADTTTIKLRILGEDRKPLANKTGLLYGREERFKVRTDGDGGISADLHKDTQQVLLRIWEKDFPKGPSRDHVLQLVDKLDDLSTPRGAMARLANLGFHKGALGDTWFEARAAISAFQRAHVDDGLEVTGELDDKTKAKLSDTHKG